MALPAYSVRVSKRARYARIKITARQGVEVVVPCGFDLDAVPALVADKHDWIEQALATVAAQQIADARDLPERIDLRAIAVRRAVRYVPAATPRIRLDETESELVLLGAVEDCSGCQEILRYWLAKRARAVLVPWLEAVATELELPFARVAIRNQRTRWGSCSARHAISLNQQLLFLPPHLVRYVFAHELCHTVHLDHSQRFWELLAVKFPEAIACRQELKLAWKYVPNWAHP